MEVCSMNMDLFRLTCFALFCVRTVAFVGTVVLVRLVVETALGGTSTILFVTAATSSATKDCAALFVVKPIASSRRTKWCNAAYARGNQLVLLYKCYVFRFVANHLYSSFKNTLQGTEIFIYTLHEQMCGDGLGSIFYLQWLTLPSILF